MLDQVDQLCKWIEKTNEIIFFGGAGVSTESGLPDFRGKQGILKTHHRAEEILTKGFLLKDPECFWSFYRAYFMPNGILPNDAHRFLAKLESIGRLQAVVTQNVDGLHQAAGSKSVLELHGSGLDFHCLDCGAAYNQADLKDMPLVPHCSCGGYIRPNIVLYQESLDEWVLERAIHLVENAQLMIVAGTSLSVYPAAQLVGLQKSGQTVLINEMPTARDHYADLLIQMPVAQVFKRCADQLGINLNVD